MTAPDPGPEPREVAVARKINDLRFDEAERDLAAWLAEEPASVRGRATLAKLRMMRGKADEAHRLYAGLAAESPSTASFHAHAGQAASDAGLDGEALAAFARALALQPGNAYYLKLLERHHLKRGAVEEAEGLYELRLRDDPEDLNALLALGVIRSSRGGRGGIDLFGFACEVAPHYARPFLLLGGDRARRGDPEGAEEAFARGVAFDLAGQTALETREKRVSLYPCLAMLHHAGLLALGMNGRLGPALTDFTLRQASLLSDARTFRDVVAPDSLQLEYSYEEALAFRLARCAARGILDPLSAEAEGLRFAARALDPAFAALAGRNLARDFAGTLETTEEAASAGRLSLPAALARAFAAQESREPALASACAGATSPDPDLPAARLLRVFLDAVARPGREGPAEAADRFASLRAIPGFPFPEAAALGEAWAASLVLDFPRSNERYLAHLANDPTLSLTRAFAADYGPFLLQ